MSSHIKTVTETRRNKVTVYNKDGYLYLNFRLNGKRKQKALKMKDTKSNRKVVEKEIIPQLQAKIALCIEELAILPNMVTFPMGKILEMFHSSL